MQFKEKNISNSELDTLIYNQIATLTEDHSAINLALGYSTIPSPTWMREILMKEFTSIEFSEHPYGSMSLRNEVINEIKIQTSMDYDPVTEVTIAGSASELIFASIISIIKNGDGVIIFEPAFSIYTPIVRLAGGIPIFIKINYATGEFDLDLLKQSFDNQTKLLILNNPHSPTGKIFNIDELNLIASLCDQWGTKILSDEVFDRIILDASAHHSIASLPAAQERTIVVGDTGKKFNLKGLKIGYAVAPVDLTLQLRLYQQLITYRNSTPIETSFAQILSAASGRGYYRQLIAKLFVKQTRFKEALVRIGYSVLTSAAGYFILLETKDMAINNSLEFAKFLIEKWGIATLPGRAFYWDKSPNATDGDLFVRICFARENNLLDEALILLEKAGLELKKRA